MVGDRIGDIFAYILFIFMFLLGIFVFIWQFDRIKDDAVRDLTLEFVNECQCTGKISPQNYNKYSNKIGSIGHYYASLEYESLRSYPEETPTGVVTGYFRDYYAYSNDDILDAMYTPTGEHDYEMKNGDKLIVTVKNRGSQSSHWLGIIFGDNHSNQMITRRTGTIGNNVLGD
jgi:hypothetical protein